MITYLVEYIDPLFGDEPQFSYSEGLDKTEARDLFYGANPDVERIIKLTKAAPSEV
jgi:hypothetical protein